MHFSGVTQSSDQGDSDVLQILLKLSDIRPLEWEPQFPFLDSTTVSRASQSVSQIIFKGRLDLKKLLVPKLRKWCTGNNKSHDLAHSTWIGRPLSVRDCIESVLSVCIPILRNAEDWAKRDVEQQMALCYAILGAATSSPAPLHPEAGDICSLLVERILGLKELDFQHHRFLAQVWNSVGELPRLKIEVLIQMSERSFLGIERTILWLGRRAVKDNHQAIPESYKTIVGSTLLEVCSQSPFVFQKVSCLLTHMMAVSEAHPGVQALINSFISGVEGECLKGNYDLCALYDESCQVLSALLCVDPCLLPEHGALTLSREIVLQMLYKLPRNAAACLLSHRPNWLLYTF